MADPLLMDRMFQHIMRGLIDRGVAPHYIELARALGLSVEEGRHLLLDVMHAYPIGWLHPETYDIASFPPLNSQPTAFRISVRGQQRWFAQCGFEATGVTWLFPGETVRCRLPVELVPTTRGGAARRPHADRQEQPVLAGDARSVRAGLRCKKGPLAVARRRPPSRGLAPGHPMPDYRRGVLPIGLARADHPRRVLAAVSYARHAKSGRRPAGSPQGGNFGHPGIRLSR